MITKLSLLGLILSTTLSHGSSLSINKLRHLGDEKGNGGDVVYCESGRPFRIQLLDYYERKVLEPSFVIDLGGSGLTVDQKVKLYLKKLGRVSKIRAKKYADVYKNFFDRVLWLRNTRLVDVPDSNHNFIPVGCETRQIAIQFKDLEQVPGKRYLIDQDLWDQLDNDHKAGLVLHEIIYQEAIANGHSNSIEARKINSWIASQAFSRVVKTEFSEYMRKVKLPTYEMMEGYDELYIDEWSYNEDGVVGGKVSHPSYIPILGRRIALDPGAMAYFENGRLISLHDYCFPNGYDLIIGNNTFQSEKICNRSIYFYSNGVPKELIPAGYQEVEINSPVGKLQAHFGARTGSGSREYSIGFHENGMLSKVMLSRPKMFQTDLSPDSLTVTEISFNSSGKLIGGKLLRPARLQYNKGYVLAGDLFKLHESGFLKEVLFENGTQDILDLEINGKAIKVTGMVNFNSLGEVKGGTALPGEKIFLYGKSRSLRPYYTVGMSYNNYGKEEFQIALEDDESFEIDGHRLICSVGGGGKNPEFYSNYALRSCQYSKGSKFSLFGKVYEAKSDSYGDSVSFYPSGKLAQIRYYDGVIEAKIRGRTYSTDTGMEFHPNGVISYFWNLNDALFENEYGQMVPVKARAHVKFNEEGFLID